MAIIELSKGFELIPEGRHIFTINDVEYVEEFGKLELKMRTDDGHYHTERFYLIAKNGEPNIPALNAFSYFARTALNDPKITDIDPEDLRGRQIEAVIEHTEGEKTTFARMTEKYPVEGPAGMAPPAPEASGFDLDNLFDI